MALVGIYVILTSIIGGMAEGTAFVVTTQEHLRGDGLLKGETPATLPSRFNSSSLLFRIPPSFVGPETPTTHTPDVTSSPSSPAPVTDEALIRYDPPMIRYDTALETDNGGLKHTPDHPSNKNHDTPLTSDRQSNKNRDIPLIPNHPNNKNYGAPLADHLRENGIRQFSSQNSNRFNGGGFINQSSRRPGSTEAQNNNRFNNQPLNNNRFNNQGLNNNRFVGSDVGAAVTMVESLVNDVVRRPSGDRPGYVMINSPNPAILNQLVTALTRRYGTSSVLQEPSAIENFIANNPNRNAVRPNVSPVGLNSIPRLPVFPFEHFVPSDAPPISPIPPVPIFPHASHWQPKEATEMSEVEYIRRQLASIAHVTVSSGTLINDTLATNKLATENVGSQVRGLSEVGNIDEPSSNIIPNNNALYNNNGPKINNSLANTDKDNEYNNNEDESFHKENSDDMGIINRLNSTTFGNHSEVTNHTDNAFNSSNFTTMLENQESFNNVIQNSTFHDITNSASENNNILWADIKGGGLNGFGQLTTHAGVYINNVFHPKEESKEIVQNESSHKIINYVENESEAIDNVYDHDETRGNMKHANHINVANSLVNNNTVKQPSLTKHDNSLVNNNTLNQPSLTKHDNSLVNNNTVNQPSLTKHDNSLVNNNTLNQPSLTKHDNSLVNNNTVKQPSLTKHDNSLVNNNTVKQPSLTKHDNSLVNNNTVKQPSLTKHDNSLVNNNTVKQPSLTKHDNSLVNNNTVKQPSLTKHDNSLVNNNTVNQPSLTKHDNSLVNNNTVKQPSLTKHDNSLVNNNTVKQPSLTKHDNSLVNNNTVKQPSLTKHDNSLVNNNTVKQPSLTKHDNSLVNNNTVKQPSLTKHDNSLVNNNTVKQPSLTKHDNSLVNNNTLNQPSLTKHDNSLVNNNTVKQPSLTKHDNFIDDSVTLETKFTLVSITENKPGDPTLVDLIPVQNENHVTQNTSEVLQGGQLEEPVYEDVVGGGGSYNEDYYEEIDGEMVLSPTKFMRRAGPMDYDHYQYDNDDANPMAIQWPVDVPGVNSSVVENQVTGNETKTIHVVINRPTKIYMESDKLVGMNTANEQPINSEEASENEINNIDEENEKMGKEGATENDNERERVEFDEVSDDSQRDNEDTLNSEVDSSPKDNEHNINSEINILTHRYNPAYYRQSDSFSHPLPSNFFPTRPPAPAPVRPTPPRPQLTPEQEALISRLPLGTQQVVSTIVQAVQAVPSSAPSPQIPHSDPPGPHNPPSFPAHPSRNVFPNTFPMPYYPVFSSYPYYPPLTNNYHYPPTTTTTDHYPPQQASSGQGANLPFHPQIQFGTHNHGAHHHTTHDHSFHNHGVHDHTSHSHVTPTPGRTTHDHHSHTHGHGTHNHGTHTHDTHNHRTHSSGNPSDRTEDTGVSNVGGSRNRVNVSGGDGTGAGATPLTPGPTSNLQPEAATLDPEVGSTRLGEAAGPGTIEEVGVRDNVNRQGILAQGARPDRNQGTLQLRQDPHQMGHGRPSPSRTTQYRPPQQAAMSMSMPVVNVVVPQAAAPDPPSAQDEGPLIDLLDNEVEEVSTVSDTGPPSMDREEVNSLLQSLFSSPTLLLLGIVFATSAAYMAITMEEQAAQQRFQQAQLAAAFSGQNFPQPGRRRRDVVLPPTLHLPPTLPKAWS